MTLREAVASLGFEVENLAHPAIVRYADDLDVTVKPAVAEDGSVYCYCSGEALFAFVPTRRTLRSLYLVRDSQEADVWDWKRRSEFDGDAGRAIVALGAKPRVRLRLVQSA